MKEQVRQNIIEVCQKLFSVEPIIVLTRPDEQFGDFATNLAMQLSKTLQKNPREIAQLIATELQLSPLFTSVGVAGPGFINMTLTDDSLISSIKETQSKSLSGMKVLVEYSDPNPFKPLHAGHLYTTLVGDVIARLVENAGAETFRLNYGGDVGRHVGISMWAIMKNLGDNPVETLEAIPLSERADWMGQCYVEGTVAYEQDEHAKVEILAMNKNVYALHAENDHESEFAQIYWTLRSDSYDFFRKLYTDLGVHEFDRFIPESEVTPLGIEILNMQLNNGVFEKSDGAVIFDGEKQGLHTRVFINSEGLPTYETKELGNMFTKWDDYKFDQSIIITANEQLQYMQVVLKAIEQFEPIITERTRHLVHGIVKLAGGVKMSSRKGNSLSAFDVLDAAKQAGKSSGQASTEDIVLAAVKYAFLKNKIGGDIIYDPEESVATEGNSGPYLQYAHARAKSILKKGTGLSVKGVVATEGLDRTERTLVRKLSEYSELIELATRELAPHHICTYLYELAQTFNRFYEQSKVIGDPREAFRVSLVAQYAQTLKNGLQLLGIHAPEQM